MKNGVDVSSWNSTQYSNINIRPTCQKPQQNSNFNFTGHKRTSAHPMKMDYFLVFLVWLFKFMDECLHLNSLGLKLSLILWHNSEKILKTFESTFGIEFWAPVHPNCKIYATFLSPSNKIMQYFASSMFLLSKRWSKAIQKVILFVFYFISCLSNTQWIVILFMKERKIVFGLLYHSGYHELLKSIFFLWYCLFLIVSCLLHRNAVLFTEKNFLHSRLAQRLAWKLVKPTWKSSSFEEVLAIDDQSLDQFWINWFKWHVNPCDQLYIGQDQLKRLHPLVSKLLRGTCHPLSPRNW